MRIVIVRTWIFQEKKLQLSCALRLLNSYWIMPGLGILSGVVGYVNSDSEHVAE